jgi:hypothetical protein
MLVNNSIIPYRKGIINLETKKIKIKVVGF